MKEHFWYFTTAHLGYPFGQDLRDFPMIADTGNYLVLRLLLLVTGDVGLTFNLFYFGSFAAIFVATFVSSRRLRCTQPTAFLVATAYMFAPFHFGHNSGHLFLSNYSTIPIWISALVLEMNGEFSQIDDREVVARLGSKVFYWSVIPSAFFGTYFAAFFLLSSFFAILLCRFRYRYSARRLIISSIVVMLALIVQALPTVIFQFRFGANLGLTARSFGQLDFYALRPLRMLLPGPTHAISIVRDWVNHRPSEFLQGENVHQIGLLGSLAFAISGVGYVLNRLKRTRIRHPLGVVLALALFLMACGVVGGFSSAFGLLGLTEVRVWDRVAIPIGFCCLVLGGFLVDTVRFKMGKSLIILVLALAAIGEQVPFNARPNYRKIEQSWQEDMFAGRVLRDRFGSGAKVFQYPITEFPESPTVVGMADYEHLRPRLHSNSLYFSYGGVRGRGPRWLSRLSPDFARLVREVAALGFDVLWIDRRGIDDGGSEISELMVREFGARPIQLRQGSVYVYDLSSLRLNNDSKIDANNLSRTIWNPLFLEVREGADLNPAGQWLVRADAEHVNLFAINLAKRSILAEVSFVSSARPDISAAMTHCRTTRNGDQRFETRCRLEVDKNGTGLDIRFAKRHSSQMSPPITLTEIQVIDTIE